MKRRLLLSIACASVAATTHAAIVDDILALTEGKRTKVVWSREVGAVNHAYGIGGTFRLMRFDTDEGTEADVLGNTANYFRAKLTWDGNRIIYNRGADLFSVGFDGGNNALIKTNAVLGCLWYSESTGREYAFVATGSGALTSDNTTADLYRLNLADVSDNVLIFSGSYAPIWLSVSRDGAKLGGHFPWTYSSSPNPGGGIFDVVSRTLDSFGQYG